MKKTYTKCFRLASLIMAVMVSAASITQAQTTLTYSFTGSMQTFTVPSCVASVTILAAGAKGIGTTAPYVWAPGNGGWAKGILSVTGGQVLNIFVGGTNGYNGGGIGLLGANGGGASDVRVGGTLVANRVIVAGGGGGAGGDNWACLVGAGHGGGGTAVGANFVGGEGGGGYTSGTGCGTNGGNLGGAGGNGTHGGGGGGGGLTTGGQGAVSTVPGTAGTGSLGLGGDAFNAAGCATYGTGGGGGGYYGGGGAAGNNCGAGRGGGGSSWTGTLASPSFTGGTNTGNGVVYITYDFGIPSLTISGSTPTLVCQGTTMTLTATGATSYTWNTLQTGSVIVVTPTVNTTYSVASQGTAACPAYGLYKVAMIQWPNITATASPNYTVCPGAPVILTASGADFYNWSGGATNGVPFPVGGTMVYTVTGTSTLTGCSNTTSILVPVYNASVNVSAASTICSGSSVTLTANGNLITYHWVWSGGVGAFQSIVVSPSVTTVYTINATSADFCNATNTTTITVNPSPNVLAAADRTHICIGESAQLTGSGATSYVWNGGGNTSVMTVTPNFSATYTVTGTTNNCSKTATVYVKASLCSGIGEELESGNSLISVYPNPTTGQFSIKAEAEMQLNLVNELGQLVKVIQLNKGNNFKAQVTDLSAGMYFLNGTVTNEKVNYKIIVNK